MASVMLRDEIPAKKETTSVPSASGLLFEQSENGGKK
jgi:hypothetical protein